RSSTRTVGCANAFRENARHHAKNLKATRLLVVAPYVRAQQAATLQEVDVDFADLAGNAHLEAPGLYVHIEGRKPQHPRQERPIAPAKGWVKTVLALLLRPELVQAPLRTLAVEAGVARGTAAACVLDLQARGFLRGEGRQRRLFDRTQLVATWVQAYGNRLRPGLQERWIQIQAQRKQDIWDRLLTAFDERHVPWTLTGADAAERTTHYLRTEFTEIYADPREFDDRQLLKRLAAQPGATRGNLLVIEPPGPLAITAATLEEKIPVTPPLLIYAELRYRGDEQALEAAELLLPKVTAE